MPRTAAGGSCTTTSRDYLSVICCPLERRGTDVDPQEEALQGQERAAAAAGVQRRGVGGDAAAASDGIGSGDRPDGRDDRCLHTAEVADGDDLRANRRGRPSRQATG